MAELKGLFTSVPPRFLRCILGGCGVLCGQYPQGPAIWRQAAVALPVAPGLAWPSALSFVWLTPMFPSLCATNCTGLQDKHNCHIDGVALECWRHRNKATCKFVCTFCLQKAGQMYRKKSKGEVANVSGFPWHITHVNTRGISCCFHFQFSRSPTQDPGAIVNIW